MNLANRMSWRYLFARKSTNAINIITFIAAFGVAIGAAALVMVLSVFNGFESLFEELFNNLNPDVRITVREGKTFDVDETMLEGLYRIPGMEAISETLEETAMFSYDDKRSPGRIKGVDANYARINGIDSMVRDGSYGLYTEDGPESSAVIGNQLGIALGVDPLNQFTPLRVYMARPKPRGGGFLTSGRASYLTRDFQPTGIIRSQEALENQGVFIPLERARNLMSVSDSTVSSLEIKLAGDYNNEDTYAAIQAYVGERFDVKDRYQQENGILKLMQIEKWVAFAIVVLMMILISFNLVGALWMIVLEKRRDISILRSLGMTSAQVRNIFLRVGILLCLIGLGTGFLIAVILFVLQKNYGLISLPGLMTEAYPISFRLSDFAVVTATVLGIGLIASLLPARRAGSVSAIINEE